MEYVSSFLELEVYQLARELAKDIFKVSKSFPKEEMYSLTSQIRKASRSIGAQISEAWGKRRYINHFTSKLTDADGEQLETKHWTLMAFDCEYIDKTKADEWLEKCASIGRMLNKMFEKADSFVAYKIKEDKKAAVTKS